MLTYKSTLRFSHPRGALNSLVLNAFYYGVIASTSLRALCRSVTYREVRSLPARRLGASYLPAGNAFYRYGVDFAFLTLAVP